LLIHHLNCGILHAPPNPQAACHCLLIESDGRLALVDTGIGLLDVASPAARIPQAAIDAAGFHFHERLTAVRQIERLGYHSADVADIVLTHGDPDHAGGLADFPAAKVHASAEEIARIASGAPRYSPSQFEHQPRWMAHGRSDERWFGLEARPLSLSIGVEAMLIPLFGHTLGHCGVAIRDGNGWLLHVGDAYYLRAELSTDDHPVSALAAMMADDDFQRRVSLHRLRDLAESGQTNLAMVGYHDFGEF
jgi:glyoxylase-like metal-dependent hydrolase (beta-lactamase superfamily II)